MSAEEAPMRSAEISIWRGMRDRCENSTNKSFKNYGGRGIKVCDRWRLSFNDFYADLGPRPSPYHSIDRIDNNGNYEPGNCRWAVPVEQANNMRSTRFVEYQGRSMSVPDWERELGMWPGELRQRIAQGWAIENALKVPSTPKHAKKLASRHKRSRRNRGKRPDDVKMMISAMDRYVRHVAAKNKHNFKD